MAAGEEFERPSRLHAADSSMNGPAGSAPSSGSVVDLSAFRNDSYKPGRGIALIALWMLINRVMFGTWFPWSSRIKAAILRAFGARVGTGVVLKNRINVKYPWNLEVGDHAWIGEGVWIDSLGPVRIGANACLSQGCMIETGNHDWSKATFDLIVRAVAIDDGAWAAAQSLLLPGSRLASHAVLSAGSVLSGDTEPYAIYAGNPARKVKDRVIRAQ